MPLGFSSLKKKKNLRLCVWLMVTEVSDSESLFFNVRGSLGPLDDPLVCIYMLEASPPSPACSLGCPAEQHSFD